LTLQSYIALNNAVKLPILGLGTFQIKGENAYNVTKFALIHGYRHFDTARIYRNEEQIGRAIKEIGIPRDQIFITSKLSPKDIRGYNEARDACLSSCNHFGGYMDLYLIHWPAVQGLPKESLENQKKRKSSWQALEALYREGKCRAIGVSNYKIEHLTDILEYCEIIPAVNQIEFHPKLFPKEIIEFCEKYNIHVWAYSSLGQGKLLDDPVVVEIANQNNLTPALILLRWALQKGTAIIPKSKSEERILENLKIFQFVLDPLSMERLDALNDGTRFCWDSTGIP